VNPFSRISPAVHEAHVAFDAVRSSLVQLGSLKHMLRLLLKMQDDTKAPSGAASIKPLKALVDQLNLNANRCFDKVPPAFQRVNIEGPPEMLMFSVRVIT
jgi:hypothetical protein